MTEIAGWGRISRLQSAAARDRADACHARAATAFAPARLWRGPSSPRPIPRKSTGGIVDFHHPVAADHGGDARGFGVQRRGNCSIPSCHRSASMLRFHGAARPRLSARAQAVCQTAQHRLAFKCFQTMSRGGSAVDKIPH